mmetsp:Transcript_27281/g.78536  ORF Transcript_27281/g.78536 Transcript_27281/m.78536 type:complete len:333 (+) Transcript_27281:78-1076(+)
MPDAAGDGGFVGFGRILRRAEFWAEDALAAASSSVSADANKQRTPSVLSFASTATGGQDGLAPVAQLTADEAVELRRTALAELSDDMATVLVTSTQGPWIRGQLEWGKFKPEEVVFTLVEIKPGYVVVGDIGDGPDLFRKVAWRLKSVNGDASIGPQAIGRGDRLILESPRWAMEHLGRAHRLPELARARRPAASGGNSGASAEVQHYPPAMAGQRSAVNAGGSTASSAVAPMVGGRLPAAPALGGLDAQGHAAPREDGLWLGGDVPVLESYEAQTPSRPTGRPPNVPRLYLEGLHGVPVNKSRSCGMFGCMEDQPNSERCTISLTSCGKLW